MASISLVPAANIEAVPNAGPRHGRKHSRHPTVHVPLPSFSYHPGTPSQGGEQEPTDHDKENDLMMGLGHTRRQSKLENLPSFTFNPGADLPVQRTPSPTHPILEEMALNQQRVSKSAKPAPIMAYTFNPGTPIGSGSPTRPEADIESLRTAAGHRRADSKFVGGKADGIQPVSISPSKHEAKPSTLSISGPGVRHPGHTHRRSQAISISDIDTSDLIKQHALAKARAPSIPSTPQDAIFTFPRASPNHTHKYTQSVTRSPPSSPRKGSSMSGYRPRTVDFSDTVDVIPRPLSMISSETERSSSTIRGHSVSNSINSIASHAPLGSADLTLSMSMPTGDSIFKRRPNTADASFLLSNSEIDKEENLLSMPKRPLSASGSPMISSGGSPPPKKKHFWSAHGADITPMPTPPHEQTDPFDSVTQRPGSFEETRAKPKAAPERPVAHRRRKYHTWTAGIFSKKSKHRSTKKPKRSATPPSLLRRDSDQLNSVFDTDDTVVLREDSPVGSRAQAITIAYGPSIGSLASFDTPSQMIDLDAALDPFTDDRRHSDDHNRSAASRMAKLHSSERRAVVDAFGTSHRRTESAPALSPVNRSALFGMRHQGSNASLGEEVFDEKEEDKFLAHEEEVKSHSIHEPNDHHRTPKLVLPKGGGGLGLSNLASRVDDVVIIDADEETEASQSSKSTVEAPILFAEDLPKRPSTSPMSFAYPNTQSHYASSTEGRTTSASLISSPDFENSPFDTHSRNKRLGEYNIDSLRPSTDDLPSLSDSASSNVFPRISYTANARPSLEHRSNSMFVPGSSKASENWKRSSLASLNRLIPGSSHGSKLKLESLQADSDEKLKKKTNRLSKLMRFWRSKETEDRQHADV